MSTNFFQSVYTLTKKIPRGKVATYGQIAALIGRPRAAQMVGWALHALDGGKDKSVPWQRVINRHGDISTTCLEHTSDEQAFLLKSEGVVVEKKEGAWHVDLARFLWKSQK